MSAALNTATGQANFQIDGGTKLTVAGAVSDASQLIATSGGPFKFGQLRSQRGTYTTVLQCVTQLVNTIATYSAPGYSSTQTIITPLSITITPTSASSKLVVLWQICGEGSYNMLYRVWRDGAQQSDGTNTTIEDNANLNYSVGYAVHPYDYGGDIASTMNNLPILYSCIAGSTAATTFQLGLGSSASGANSLTLNRTTNGAAGGQDAYEVAVSHVTVWEISQ